MGILQRAWNALIQRDAGRLSGRRSVGVSRHAGVYVDQDKAMTFSAVWAACRLVSETVAMLPWGYHEELDNGGNKKLTKDSLSRVLRRQANPEMTAFTWKQVAVYHALMWGNSYSEIERDNAGNVIAIWPMLPDRTTPIRQGRALVYEYNLGSGEKVFLPATSVLHIRGLSFDGIMGLDVLTYLARTAAIGVAMDSFQAAFFANGTHVSGGLFHPKTLSKDAQKRLRDEFEEVYRGPTNAFRMGVFEEGLEWKSFQISPEAAQMIEAKKLTINDVARFFRVPPHKLADLERATFSNIEEQNLDFKTDTIQPWVTRFEAEADLKLVPPRYPNRYTKFNMEALMRGRQKDRYEAYHIARLDGWLNANEIRAWEELQPIAGPVGDSYWMPVNMMEAEMQLEGPPDPAPAAPDAAQTTDGGDPAGDTPPKPARAAFAVQHTLTQAWSRIFRREAARIETIEKNGYSEPVRAQKISEFARQHEVFSYDELLPACLDMASSFSERSDNWEAKARSVASAMARRYVAGGQTVQADLNARAADWSTQTKKAILEVFSAEG